MKEHSLHKSVMRRALFWGMMVLGALIAYAGSYLCGRTITTTSTLNSCFGTVGVTRFTYFGGVPGRAYAHAQGDAKFLYMEELGVWARILGADAPPREENWYTAVYIPLEQLELYCRDITPVTLSDEEKKEMAETFDGMKDKPIHTIPY